VLDAMTGQQATEVATAFKQRIAYDGVILTKLDGDARGGAALSVREVTGAPIVFVATGERPEALEVFHPERMASRIVGMGDVLSLIERAERAVSADEQSEMERRMRQGQFSFEDFLQAQRMLRRMGPLQGLLKMMPGMGQLQGLDVDESRLTRVEAIILSMTPRERSLPHVIDGKRRARIASGSGATVPEVNQLLEARKVMEKMMGQLGKGKMPALPGLTELGGGGPGQRPSPPRKKKNKRRAGRR
jgi:signal recognition particle subunit SRP54